MMSLWELVIKAISGDWVPGEVFTSDCGFRVETISPTQFILTADGTNKRTVFDISELLNTQ